MTTVSTAEQEIKEIADKYYAMNPAMAFRHWALTCLLADQKPDDADIKKHIELGTSGNLEIDGYWIDELNSRIILLKSRYSSDEGAYVARAFVHWFRMAAQKLTDDEYVNENASAKMKTAHSELMEFILDDDYSLYLAVITNRRVEPNAREYVEKEGSTQWQFEYEGGSYSKDVEVEVLEIQDLENVREELLRPIPMATDEPSQPATPEVELTIPEGMFHEIQGQFRAAQATVLAKEVVEAYQKYRASIFELNVRGPLGANKVNKEIVKSLEFPVYRKNFHVLNNGITVLCDRFEYDPAAGKLKIDDFQVANGCQTTYTLYKHRNKVDDTVWLKMTVVEGHSWAPMIAKSTNTQSTVKPEDFASLDRIHAELKRKFAMLNPPWLYEVRRGESKFHTNEQLRDETDKFSDRKITMREVAQSALSFIGEPAMAAWRLHTLFDSRNDTGVALYRKIFNDEVSPDQLVLATLVARAVHDKVSNIVSRSADDEKIGRLANVDWLPIARPFIVGLIAEWLRIDGKYDNETGEFLPLDAARKRIEDIPEWFDKAFDMGAEAVMYRMDVTTASSGSIKYLREFFRTPENYKKMLERLQKQMTVHPSSKPQQPSP